MPHHAPLRSLAARSLREVARAAVLLAALLPCGSARSQGGPAGPNGLLRMVASDAAPLLRHADAAVRGEAAIVLATRRDPYDFAAIAAVASDPNERAKVRGILALGMLATPAAALALGDRLADAGTRTQPAGIAAAYALGAMPPEVAPTTVCRVLTSFLQGSYKRQRELLLALLQGMQGAEQTEQLTALRRLFDDESLRDPELRAVLLTLLLPIDPSLDGARLRRLLERGSEEEREALVGWLAHNPSAADSTLLQPLERLAVQGNRPQLRAAALATLTRMRHLPALELAARALRSQHPAEVAQATISALQIGGAGMRGALERHLAAETDPDLQEAMLRAWASPPSPDLVDTCVRLATDRSRPVGLRTAAALTVARSDADRGAPLLRDLFRAADRAFDLAPLAAALRQGGAAETPLSRLVDGPAELRQHPGQWRALLATEHPEATRQVLAELRNRTAPADDLAIALRVWREATTNLTELRVQSLPPSLRSALE